MALEHIGDWTLEATTAEAPRRLYHVHRKNMDKWGILSAVIDGKCRECNEEAPKSLRIRAAFWGIDNASRSAGK